MTSLDSDYKHQPVLTSEHEGGRESAMKKKKFSSKRRTFIVSSKWVVGRVGGCANEGNYGNENGNSTREAHRGFVHGLNLQMTR